MRLTGVVHGVHGATGMTQTTQTTPDEKRLTIRLSGRLKDAVVEAAQALEMTPSAYVRMVLIRGLKEAQ